MRPRTKAGLIAAAAAVALVTGVSVVWPGLDAQDTPPTDPSVWVLQSDGQRYARVNTVVGELDTVRSVANPTRIVSSANGVYMFTDSDSKLVRIEEAAPVDLDAAGLEAAVSAPSGVRETVTAGDFVAYRTDDGAVHVGRLSSGTTSRLDPDGPRENQDAAQYAAEAIALDERGVLLSYSAADGAVLRYDIAASELRGRDPLVAELTAPQLSSADGEWVLFDSANGMYWTADAEDEQSSGTGGGALMSRPASDGDAVYVADETGMVRIPVDGSDATSIFGDGATVQGAPARPVWVGGVVYGAWLAEGAGPGALWRSDTGRADLDYGGLSLPSQRRPVFAASGETVVLNDARSGWVWRAADGALLPSSQDWTLDQRRELEAEPTEDEQRVVIDPRPPVAVDDAFGVRPGALVALPNLLNDHDPNEDVLTIDPESVTGLDPGFGELSITDNRQRLVVRVSADASGTASFRYRVTDGTSEDGLFSEEAVVTLRVAADDVNTAPQWCVSDCRQEWPSPTVARGGTVTVPVLSDWVDPEGDPVLLLSAEGSGHGSVVVTPAGDVVFQHADDGNASDETVAVQVSVADARGAISTRALEIRVVGEPQPVLQSFAVVDTVGSRLTVDVAAHVTGTAGETTVTGARVLDDAAATATVVGGTTQFDFSAAGPGVYRVAVTVAVAGREATGIARITLLPEDAPAQLSTAPVVAFVRPQVDATVDVFAAVSNPTHRVLLISDVIPSSSAGATLSVDTVGQSQLRVSGSTSDGEPGMLGTVGYRVSDGTNDTGAAVDGQATVYLLPPAPDAPPIAVDDTVVVRAGTQTDIPVLRNDISAAGSRPRIAPDSVVSSTDRALAFASADVLRYLAPAEPGEYTVEYAAYTPGSPSDTDTAVVRIRVLSDEANRAPLPVALSGRVLSGLSTSIAFDGFGVDPDGDAVRLDAIVSQPESGSASISADGTAIVYTSVPGARGQYEFHYRVVDAAGAEGEGRVRVGVLDTDANPSPVTYTDYVHVQAGAGNTIRISPLANDVDPTQGRLHLTDVVPDVPEKTLDGADSAEYAQLAERIVSIDDGTVMIAASEQPGTMAFLYDVASSSKNTARGLIVVRVIPERVPEHPVVVDTVLTVEDRDEFGAGVPVLDGTVTWGGGDVDDLELGLWGSPVDVEVSGDRLRGALTDAARLIPFSVTGLDGEDPVTTYAFLRVPAAAESPLALRPGLAPIVVAEGDERVIDVAPLVVRPPGAPVQVGDAVTASGSRAAARCEQSSATSVRYVAGTGAPWTDACLVPVRADDAAEWTMLSIPIAVTARDPQPELSPAALTVAPGQSESYDLADMTRWRGTPAPESLRYEIAPPSRAFTATLEGSVVTITADGAAVPGTEEAVIVEIASHPGVAPARINLRVGAVPSTLPQGGTVTATCSQADGSSCVIEVIGATGEVNPLPSTPLTVAAVRAGAGCSGVSFEVVEPDSIRASWTDDAPGTTCKASVTVRDAQGRDSGADRDATVTLRLQGYPPAPGGLAVAAYGDETVTLRVEPGAAGQAAPAVTGFDLRWQGMSVGQCSAEGVCPELTAPNGDKREYEAFSLNDVGASRSSASVTAWAYAAPAAPERVTAAPVVTTGDGGVVSLEIAGVDAAATSSLEISSPTGEDVVVPVAVGQTRVSVPSYRVGANTATVVTVTPQSRFSPPPSDGEAPEPPSATVSAHGIGRPTDVALTLTATNTGNGRVAVTATATAVPGGDGAQLRYGFVPDGHTCTVSGTQATATFRGLDDGRAYRFVVCVESFSGGTSYGRAAARGEVRAVQSTAAPTGYEFTVGPTPHIDGQRANWTIDQEPTSSEQPPFGNDVVFRGHPSDVFDTDPGIQVRYEHSAGWWVSEWGAATPARGSAPYQVQARWWIDPCVGGTVIAGRSSSTGDRARVVYSSANVVYLDADGDELDPGADPWRVPEAAVRVTGIGVTVDWRGQGWNLRPATAEFSAVCTPAAP
ncbi:Ig-like domain-containing protein [Microbacterium sp.]|uniref:Ig-like domain-containing protein n=1 Tax=Microbacterium sp. TaxID=51671 RepID=UPI003A8AE30F